MSHFDIKGVAKGTINEVLAYRYHRTHRMTVSSILKAIEPRFGKLSPANMKRADAYARDVLGHQHFAPWLYVYATFAGAFKEGWIPPNYYGRVVVPALNGWYGRTSFLKPLAGAIFRSDAFPDLACYVNGLFLTPDFVPIPRDKVADVVFADTDKIAYKADNSGQGRGISFLSGPDFDVSEIERLGNGVFQTFIRQHETFERYAANSVATVRLTTAVDDEGRVSLRACYLRLGRSTDTHVRSKTHVRVAIDLASGEFAPEGFLADWRAVEAHPDTQVKFAGQRIPAFSRCVSTVLDLHAKVPCVRCVGWDVAVDADEKVWIMEWNGTHNDIKFSEATQGPCFADLHWERLPH